MTRKFYRHPLTVIEMASNLAWRLTRPSQLPETAGDITQYSFGWLQRPGYEEYVAVIDTDVILRIHDFIIESLSAGNGVSVYFDQFYPTPEESAEKKDLVINSGGSIMTSAIIPNNWVDTPYAELEEEGWFDHD